MVTLAVTYAHEKDKITDMILDLIALENDSKVWIYAADKELSYEDLDLVREEISQFLPKWTSHSNELITYGNVFHRRFLAFFVDERNSSASGCSIDSSVRFVKSLGHKLNVDFFKRMTYYYMIDEEIFSIQHHELPTAYADGQINDQTLFFDNLVQTKGAFLKEWLKPLCGSWIYKFVN